MYILGCHAILLRQAWSKEENQTLLGKSDAGRTFVSSKNVRTQSAAPSAVVFANHACTLDNYDQHFITTRTAQVETYSVIHGAENFPTKVTASVRITYWYIGANTSEHIPCVLYVSLKDGSPYDDSISQVSTSNRNDMPSIPTAPLGSCWLRWRR